MIEPHKPFLTVFSYRRRWVYVRTRRRHKMRRRVLGGWLIAQSYKRLENDVLG